MKQLLLVLLTISSFTLKAQQNTLLDQSFWKSNPDLVAVKAAIEKGNSPSETNRMGNDAVVNAINAQAPADIITFLIDQKGNDVNKLTHDARTYIFWAVSRGNIEVIEYLLSKGAKVNFEDSHSSTPISFAATTGQTNTKIYDALIKAGANVKQKTPEGASLLLLAIASDKDLALTNYFISKGLSLKDTDAAGNTAFNYVARSGNISLMKTLIEKGVAYTDNAMIMAAQGSRGAANGIEVYQYLESLGIKPNAVNKNGENALHAIARKANQQDIIKYFLSKGANVNQADNDGTTPFMVAAGFNRDTATVTLFLAAVKNINQVNKKGQSALTLAVRNNSPELVQFLISKSADINVVDAEGNNLAYYLIQSYAPQGGGPEGGRGGGAPRGDAFGPKLKILQENGFNLATAQKDGNTLYHLAIMKNDLSLLKRIENLNADVNAKNKEGLTPLQKAAMIAKDDTILKYLLSIGAKKEITTEFKETAYDMAKENEFLSKNKIALDFLK